MTYVIRLTHDTSAAYFSMCDDNHFMLDCLLNEGRFTAGFAPMLNVKEWSIMVPLKGLLLKVKLVINIPLFSDRSLLRVKLGMLKSAPIS